MSNEQSNSLGRAYSSNLKTLYDDDDIFIPTNLLSKDYVIFYHPTMEKLALKVHRALTQRHINIASSLGKITWKSFNDGFPDIFIHDIQDLVGRDIIFIAAFNSPGDIYEQLSVCSMFPSYRIGTLSILLPYSPVATMERSSCPGEVITAVTLAKMFNMIDCKTDLYLVDLHTFHNLHYFPNHIFPIFVHSAHKIKQILLTKPFEEQQNVSIVFPDSGAMQRYRYVIPPFEAVVCSKIRDGDDRYITISQGSDMINGRDLYLIDDLVHSGGTLKECIGVLRDKYQPKTINLFITHGIFEKDSWKPFVKLYEDGIIQRFYLCDTTPKAIELHGVGPFYTLSIADDLADILVHNKQAQFDELNVNDKNRLMAAAAATHVNSPPQYGIGMNGKNGGNNNGLNGSSGSNYAPSFNGSVTSPVENQLQCQQCTLLLKRHEKIFQQQQLYFNNNAGLMNASRNHHHKTHGRGNSNHSTIFASSSSFHENNNNNINTNALNINNNNNNYNESTQSNYNQSNNHTTSGFLPNNHSNPSVAHSTTGLMTGLGIGGSGTISGIGGGATGGLGAIGGMRVSQSTNNIAALGQHHSNNIADTKNTNNNNNSDSSPNNASVKTTASGGGVDGVDKKVSFDDVIVGGGQGLEPGVPLCTQSCPTSQDGSNHCNLQCINNINNHNINNNNNSGLHKGDIMIKSNDALQHIKSPSLQKHTLDQLRDEIKE